MAGALLGTFAGDALGAPFEGAPPVPGRDAAGRMGPGGGTLTYTDDTQLAIALATHLCDDPWVDPDGLARTFLEHYEAGRGYGAGMHGLVELWRSGMPVAEAATAIFADGSFGNGAAMRVAPVGVLWAHDGDALAEVAARQARVTHVHPLGVDGAVAQARAVGLAATSGSFGPEQIEAVADAAHEDELRERLQRAVDLIDRWDRDPGIGLADVADRLGNHVVAHRSVPAALWAAAVAADVPDGVALALGLGGDADTIAAMTGAVLGAAGTRHAVPGEWLERFEDGTRGRRHVLELAGRLADVAAGLSP